MYLEMGSINHDLVAIAAPFGRLDKDAPERAHRAPAYEGVVDCLVANSVPGHRSI